MTSDSLHPKNRRSAVNNNAEYFNKTIILSIYINLPHPPMQNVDFLNKRHGMAVLLLQWKETDKK